MNLSDLTDCFQGIIPSVITTCSADGEPNTTYVSQVYYVDEQHVALSCQFFNKTKRNVGENPFASVILHHPIDFNTWRMRLRFHHSETEGALFDTMKARIDVIASHTGMAGVFRLISSDIFEVISCEPVPGFLAEGDPDVDAKLLAPHAGPLTELRGVQAVSANISRARDAEELMAGVLGALDELLGFSNSMILLFDDAGETLSIAASRGYPDEMHAQSVPTGLGTIGMAARDRRVIRLMGFGAEIRYGEAIRERALEKGQGHDLAPVVPAIGLQNAQAQLALPLLAGSRLVGVLALESCDPLRFDEWDEAFLQILGNQIAMGLEQLRDARPVGSGATTRRFVYYRNEDCIFVDDEYLIRNIPARILWKLLRMHESEGRSEFSNRELRLDPSLGLPEIKDNLESRLILLRKRLEEKCFGVRIAPSRRGHFELLRDVEIELEERESA